jgi:hypothetical protein
MSDEKVCASCCYFEFGMCHRHAPQPYWLHAHTALIASLFRLYWKGDEEISRETLDDIMKKYADVSNHEYEFVAWPFIKFPDEDWCGDWKEREAK